MVVRPEGRTPIIRQSIRAIMYATAMLIGCVAVSIMVCTFTGSDFCVSVTGPSGSVGVEYSANGACEKPSVDEALSSK